MIISRHYAHYMCCVCRWGRRFRLPTPYVHAQTASSLASGYLGADFSFCHLAFGGISAEESLYPEVGRRKRLPHFNPRTVVRGSGPRDGQSCFRAGLVAGSTSGEGSGRRDPAWRDRTAVLSITRLGDHAQSCSRFAVAQFADARDYALAKRFYRAPGQPHPATNRRALLAR